jgi:hypothetical protein
MTAMAASYDEAVAELYRSPHDAFVAERQRLARELKAAGDKPGAARLLKLGRPTLSAWAVNQLWWHARESFEQLLAAAARLRAGDQAGAADRRDAVAALRARAAALLVEGGHAVNEATLRRVTTTLSALAAAGGFDPESPGALAADRDPPGFDVGGLGAALGAGAAAPAAVTAPGVRPPPPPKPKLEPPLAKSPDADVPQPAAKRSEDEREPAESDHDRAERQRAERERAERERVQREAAAREREQRERAEREEADRRRAEQEQRRVEQQRAALRAERERLAASLPSLRSDLERRQREVERLRAELRRVEGLAEQAHMAIGDAEKRLATLAAND